MPTRHSTRAACRQLPRYKGSATSAQLIFGLRRIILNRESVRQAVSLSNANSKQVADHHLLTKSTLQRYYTALPPHLQLPENATEGALLGWLITYEGGRRAERQQGRSLFGSAQEELLCQWINARCLINAAVGRREIIEHACTLLPAGSQSTMEGWYKGFRRRWTDLHSRLEQTTPHARSGGQHRQRRQLLSTARPVHSSACSAGVGGRRDRNSRRIQQSASSRRFGRH